MPNILFWIIWSSAISPDAKGTRIVTTGDTKKKGSMASGVPVPAPSIVFPKDGPLSDEFQ